MIQLQGVTKTYKQRTALSQIDLAIAAGECVGLVGTNGAGRTTLLHILATLSRPTAGQVTVGGLDIVRHRGVLRRRIGYVAESHVFYEALQVYEYLAFLAATHRLPAAQHQAAIAEVLALTALQPEAPIRTLSRGCRQQLACCAALLHRPEVLLLDEPLLHLDLLVSQRLLARLQEQRRGGTAILLACNTMETLYGLCNRVSILHRGHMVATVAMPDTLDELRQVLQTALAQQLETV